MSNEGKNVKRNWNKDGIWLVCIAALSLFVGLCFVGCDPKADISKEDLEKYEAICAEYEEQKAELEKKTTETVDLTAEVQRLSKEVEELHSENIYSVQDIFDYEMNSFPIEIDGSSYDPLWVRPNTIINYTENTNFVSKAVLCTRTPITGTDSLEEGWQFKDINTGESVDVMEVHKGLKINGKEARIQSIIILTEEEISQLDVKEVNEEFASDSTPN